MTDIYASVTQKLVNNKKSEKNIKKGKSLNKTKKVVHDLFVQGTNDSSIVSKRSVEILYNDIVDKNAKQYFQHFVKKSPRRTPVINRGYWIRMKSIRMAIEKIISQQPENQRINVINLGCGYDPLPFQLLDDAKFSNRNLFCIDVDFPELMGYKCQMIHNSSELVDLVGSEHQLNEPGILMHTDTYAAMGCDLTDKQLYCKQLEFFKANNSTTTNIFIAEVSLAYMTPNTSNEIIETSSKFSNSHFLILEQLMPAGPNHPFAKRMINHFKKMEAPLQCVEFHPTISDQIERFRRLGYKYVNARDLLSCWDLVDAETKKRVESVEAFDEWEEFIYFGQHYINLHATNQKDVIVYSKDYVQLYESLDKSNDDYYFKVNMEVDSSFQRKFHSCLSFENAKFATSGTNQSRLADTISLSGDILDVVTPESFKGRNSAVAVTVDDNVYLIGGRRIPGIGLKEFWKLSKNADSYKWEEMESMEVGRVKHSAIPYKSGILVFGGSSGEGFLYYSIENRTWIDLVSDFSGLKGAKLFQSKNNIYIIGGMCDEGLSGFEFNPTLYQLQIDLDSKTVTVQSIFSHLALARFGHHVYPTDSKVIVIGGVGKKLYDQYDTIVEVDIQRKSIKSIPIPDDCWEKSNVLIGSDIIAGTNEFSVVLGGAVCYGFGSAWGGTMQVGLKKLPVSNFEFKKIN